MQIKKKFHATLTINSSVNKYKVKSNKFYLLYFFLLEKFSCSFNFSEIFDNWLPTAELVLKLKNSKKLLWYFSLIFLRENIFCYIFFWTPCMWAKNFLHPAWKRPEIYNTVWLIQLNNKPVINSETCRIEKLNHFMVQIRNHDHR